jgi:ABC-type phosphate/phosphonate transport system ATPase subunit
LIREFNESFGTTVVMVTHEQALAQRYCTRMIFLSDGKVVQDRGNVPNDKAALTGIHP